MKENISTISARLGISKSTVSRVLSGNAKKYRISDATAATVIEEAERCRYVSPRYSTGRKGAGTIGIIVPSVSNAFFADIVSVIISEVHKRGFSAIVSDSQENAGYQQESIMDMLWRQVDGIIASPCDENGSILEEIDRDKVPVVLVDRYYADSCLSYVTTNNYRGGLDATRILIGNGHKRIACIQGLSSSMPSKRRVQGYIDAMKSAGLDEYISVTGGSFSIQSGFIETKCLLTREEPPTAVFALSNTIGLGAIKAINEAGLNIPEDISIISFDNNVYLDYLSTPVTRVSQPVEDMALLATKILFEKIDGTLGKESRTCLELFPTLIRRDSVKRMA